MRDIREGGGCVRSNPMGCWMLAQGRLVAIFEGGQRCSGTGKRASGGAKETVPPLEALATKAAACISAELWEEDVDVGGDCECEFHIWCR